MVLVKIARRRSDQRFDDVDEDCCLLHAHNFSLLLLLTMTILRLSTALLLVLTLTATTTVAFQPLRGVTVQSPQGPVDVGNWLADGGGMVVFGTYAADFNAIEYGQRLRYYWPNKLQGKVNKCALILNCQPSAAQALKDAVDLPDSIEVWTDNKGHAGRAFGVGRGWLPENADVNPFLKLFGMLWGLGAWATLPAVIGGYLGNPWKGQPWIVDALAVGQRQGRWPDTALELDGASVKKNKFDDLPWVGEWKRRPLELATLRLQSMLGISLSQWKELSPDEQALEAGVLTQLGGCLVVDGEGKVVFDWKDPGICAVANFEDIVV